MTNQNTTIRCGCGSCSSSDNVRWVHMRVTGKATLYHNKAVPMCVGCRKKNRGSWMYTYWSPRR